MAYVIVVGLYLWCRVSYYYYDALYCLIYPSHYLFKYIYMVKVGSKFGFDSMHIIIHNDVGFKLNNKLLSILKKFYQIYMYSIHMSDLSF